MQNLSQVAIVFGLVVSALGGYGAYYYGKQNETNGSSIENGQNLITTNPTNSPIVGKIEHQTINYFQAENKSLKKDTMDDNFVDKKVNKEKNEVPIINNGFINNGGAGNTYNQTINPGLPPRNLKNLDFENLIGKIPSKKISIQVMPCFQDKETLNYSNQIFYKLEKLGYNVRIAGMGMMNFFDGEQFAIDISNDKIIIYVNQNY